MEKDTLDCNMLGSASTKPPLTKEGVWGFRNISKEYKETYENNKIETIENGTRREYQ